MTNVISIWLKPQPELNKEIFGIIQDFSRKYKVYSDLKNYKGPHVTILEMHNSKQNLRKVADSIRAITTSNNIKPFSLEINGIGYFMKFDEAYKRNFVIYLRVKNNKRLAYLKHMVDKKFIDVASMHNKRKFVPHVTITHRELDKKRFYHALKEYKNFNFIRSFRVNGIMVSKYNKRTRKALFDYIELE